MYKFLVAACCLVVLLSSAVLGDDAKLFYPKGGDVIDGMRKEKIEAQDVIPLKLLLIYALLIGAAVLVYFKLRKRNGLTFFSKGKGGNLVVSEMRMLGNRQFIFVLDYKGREMLLGVSPDKIQHLCDLSKEPSILSQENNFDAHLDSID